MTIQQFNVTYVPSEDRLLLRFNTRDSSEYRLWLTRKMTLEMLQDATKMCVDQIHSESPSSTMPEYAKTIDAFHQEALKQQVNLKTPYQSANKLPLGSDPLLVVEFAITKINEENINLCFKLSIRKKMDLVQPISMLNRLRLLLEQIVAKAEWSSTSHEPVKSSLPAPGSGAVH